MAHKDSKLISILRLGLLFPLSLTMTRSLPRLYRTDPTPSGCLCIRGQVKQQRRDWIAAYRRLQDLTPGAHGCLLHGMPCVLPGCAPGSMPAQEGPMTTILYPFVSMTYSGQGRTGPGERSSSPDWTGHQFRVTSDLPKTFFLRECIDLSARPCWSARAHVKTASCHGWQQLRAQSHNMSSQSAECPPRSPSPCPRPAAAPPVRPHFFGWWQGKCLWRRQTILWQSALAGTSVSAPEFFWAMDMVKSRAFSAPKDGTANTPRYPPCPSPSPASPPSPPPTPFRLAPPHPTPLAPHRTAPPRSSPHPQEEIHMSISVDVGFGSDSGRKTPSLQYV